MKKLLSLLFLFGFVGCSPSEKDVAETRSQNIDISISTCNLMKESSTNDGVLRLREINTAREKMGKELFLGTDSDVRQSINYGLCSLLVLDDPIYETKLKERIDSEKAQRLLAEQERAKEPKGAQPIDAIDKSDFDLFVYRVHILSLEDSASAMVTKLQENGIIAFTEIFGENKDLHAVYAGPFIDENDIYNNIELIHKASGVKTGEIFRWKL
jgi:hypothetical protein